MSLPEAAMIWKRIRGAQLGAKFRRQHPIGPYVADFCCLEARLVVEIDGDIHGYGDRPKRDAVRVKYMIERGFSLLRIAAVDVLRNADTVANGIAATVANPLHHPSDGSPPRTGEEL
jgi:very-short-patch-repair endonuclease